MRSMTGYGRAEAAYGNWVVAAELSGVNRKQVDIVVNLPNCLASAEVDLRKRIAAQVSRGRIHARITIEANGGSAEGAESTGPGRDSGGGAGRNVRLRFDRELAEQYLAALAGLAGSGESSPIDGGGVRASDLLRAPGVFALEEARVELGEILPAVNAVVDEALAALLLMQEAEGVHLRQDFLQRLDFVVDTRGKIADRAPEVLGRYRENLHKRLQQAGLESEDLLADERVLRELAVFADRCDISEELTRIDSHVAQFRAYLDEAENSGEAVGRPLDFLCQELNREFNTIGSKANDAAISRHVVELKTELEKIREQVQNVQ